MTYKTFIVTRNLVLALLVAVGCIGLFRGCQAVIARDNSRVTSQFPAQAGSPSGAGADEDAAARMRGKWMQSANGSGQPAYAGRQPVTRAVPAQAAAQGNAPDRQAVDSLHQEVLDMAKQPLTNGEPSGNSRRWRVKRGRLVIELRSDTNKGSTTWNRAKIDMDGDKQFDEAWDFKNGEVKRRVAPGDDENYSVTYDLRGSTWVKRAK